MPNISNIHSSFMIISTNLGKYVMETYEGIRARPGLSEEGTRNSTFHARLNAFRGLYVVVSFYLRQGDWDKCRCYCGPKIALIFISAMTGLFMRSQKTDIKKYLYITMLIGFFTGIVFPATIEINSIGEVNCFFRGGKGWITI